VTGMLYRHPAVLANMASTLDITSNGRLELGVGAGWNEEECDAYGIELGSMDDRFKRFEEGMEVVTQLLKQDRSTFKGDWYSLEDAMNNPKGPQNPLPICIGGGGLRRTIPAVVKYAHHWNYGTQTMSLEDFKMRHNVFLKACDKQGRNPDEILISTMLRYDGDAKATIKQAREYEEAGVKLGIVSIPKDKPPHIVEEIAEILA